MKKNILLFIILLTTVVIAILASCNKKEEEPCGGTGELWIENKLDSVILVNIVQIHSTDTISKDYTKHFILTGNQPYEIKITGHDYYLDTTFMIVPCDNKLMVITKP